MTPIPNLFKIGLLSLLLSSGFSQADEPFRSWKSRQGSTIEAKLAKIQQPLSNSPHRKDQPVSVTLELRNGKEITVEFDQLSAKDCEYILQTNQVGKKDRGPLPLLLSSRSSKYIYTHRGEKMIYNLFHPEHIFPVPADWSAKRAEIPNLGNYQDSDNDSALVTVNHLLWLGSAGKSNLKIGRNPERDWKKALRLVNRRIRPTDYDRGAALVNESDLRKVLLESEVPAKSMRVFTELEPSLSTLKAVTAGPNLVLLNCRAEREIETSYAYLLNVLEIKGDELTVTFRENRTTAKLEFVDSDDDKKKGYWLRFKLSDSTYLASSLREEGMELFIKDASAFSFEF